MQEGMKGKWQTRTRQKDCFHTVIGVCLAKILRNGEPRAELRSSPPTQMLPSSCYRSICLSSTEEEVFFHSQLSYLVCRVISWRTKILVISTKKKKVKLVSGTCTSRMKEIRRKMRKVVCRLKDWQCGLLGYFHSP